MIRSRLEKQQQSCVQLSERLTSLGIMRDQLRNTLRPFKTLQHYRIEGFKRVINFDTIMSRDSCLSDSACNIFQYGIRFDKSHQVGIFLIWIMGA